MLLLPLLLAAAGGAALAVEEGRGPWGWPLRAARAAAALLALVLLAAQWAVVLVRRVPADVGGALMGGGALAVEFSWVAVSFLLLITLLFPCALFLLNLECGARRSRHLVYMLAIYAAAALLLFSGDACVFYLSYELLIGLVFAVMYATANSRGGVEALLFFAGWAVVGSFLVGVAIIYMVLCCQTCTFAAIRSFRFGGDEAYYLALLLFFGFGTKLST